MDAEGEVAGGVAAFADGLVEEEGLVADAAVGVASDDQAEEDEEDQAARIPEEVEAVDLEPQGEDQVGGDAEEDSADNEKLDQGAEADAAGERVARAVFIQDAGSFRVGSRHRRGGGCLQGVSDG